MENIILIIGIVLCVTGGLFILLPLLKNRGVQVGEILAGAGTALGTVGKVIDGLRGFLPDNPGLTIADKVTGYATRGVLAAEQLYLSSQLPADRRHDEAVRLAYEFIEASGIEITDDVKKVVEGAIQGAVYLLPKTSDAIAAKE